MLKDNGLQEREALLLLTPNDVEALLLPMGQQLYLRRALAKLGNGAFPSSEPEDVTVDPLSRQPSPSGQSSPRPASSSSVEAPQEETTKGLLSAGNALDNLFSSLDIPTKEDLSTPSQPEYDPRIHLTMRATSRKVEKIYNYLPERVKERLRRTRKDRLFLSQAEDGAVSMLAKDPEVTSLTQAEWSAANLRILGQLLASGELPRSDVELYLAYTVQIHEMAEVYEWPSIMTFDTRYRELQAQHNFRWGDLRMAAHSTLLIPKRVSQNQQQFRSRPMNAPLGSKAEDCKKWLASGYRFCPFGSQCRYQHRQMEATTSAPSTQSWTKNGSA